MKGCVKYCQHFFVNLSLSFDFRNEADESSPLSTQDVEKGSQKQANLSFGDRCSLAFEKAKIYSMNDIKKIGVFFLQTTEIFS